jgi:hypothetical protein
MAATVPTRAQIMAGLERYRQGERPWPLRERTWYVDFEGGDPVPLKYVYALAVNVPPASVSTNQIKAAVQSLRLKVVDIGQRHSRLADAPGVVVRTSAALEIGRIYTRAELKERFAIQDATVNNGIFKPKGHDSVWLFVTRDKTSDRTQYQDALAGDVLTMEGQTAGRTDHLITEHAARGDELLLFYRDSKIEHPGAGFRYEGPFEYKDHDGAGPATFTLQRTQSIGPFKHGKKRTWELALDAVVALGGSAGTQEVLNWIAERYPDYNKKNAVDLFMLSVNSPTRTSYLQNSKPRRTDEGSEFDRLFKVGEGPGVRYELYDVSAHGVWEIFPDKTAGNKFGMGVRRTVDPVAIALADAAEEAEQGGAFDANNVEDARKRLISAIVRRQGQPKFRKALIEAYGGKCAITGCALPAILEAAHVHPYMGEHTNVVSNGLLLRTDIHTLFDLHLIAIEPELFTVLVSPDLDGTEYAQLRGRALRSTLRQTQLVSSDALAWHRSRCGW